MGLARDRLLCEPPERAPVPVLQRSAQSVEVEKGCFTWPQSGDAQGKVVLTHEELSLLLGGIDLAKTKHKRWYRKAPPEGNAAA